MIKGIIDPKIIFRKFMLYGLIFRFLYMKMNEEKFLKIILKDVPNAAPIIPKKGIGNVENYI